MEPTEPTITEQLQNIIKLAQDLIEKQKNQPKPPLFDVPEGVTIYLGGGVVRDVSGIICGKQKLLYNSEYDSYEVACASASDSDEVDCIKWIITPPAELALIECTVADLKPGDMFLEERKKSSHCRLVTAIDAKIIKALYWVSDYDISFPRPSVWDRTTGTIVFKFVLR